MKRRWPLAQVDRLYVALHRCQKKIARLDATRGVRNDLFCRQHTALNQLSNRRLTDFQLLGGFSQRQPRPLSARVKGRDMVAVTKRSYPAHSPPISSSGSTV